MARDGMMPCPARAAEQIEDLEGLQDRGGHAVTFWGSCEWGQPAAYWQSGHG